ncbi:hypothetical protein L21SP2_0232 [Salinispira pacifica]|uniref:Uncharacterized protein n=1 Tax=Salinispira pacifica TaxID=1307761 RepID=V5WDN4_9SPIO|nr:hypothetical protein L21SP2_0232 [Salinispira pacifica]
MHPRVYKKRNMENIYAVFSYFFVNPFGLLFTFMKALAIFTTKLY